MHSPEIKNFQECIQLATEAKGNIHLILGNGFSVDLFPNIFNYERLAERIKSPQIKRLFEEIGTNDFEYVMRKMTDALQIARLYKEGDGLITKLLEDIEKLKSNLIEVINQSHPANPKAIDDEQYKCCHTFLKHFDGGKKYSFNYDLLLYWVYMNYLDDKEMRLKCDDGFRHPDNDQSIVTWEIGRERDQNIYYIHGAMHVFSDGSIIEKYTWKNSNKTITEQVRESINLQKYPVFISEGTREHKVSRIQDNSYLGRAFSSLKSIGGNIFIFGHSLRNEDDHVFDYINIHSKVKNIFISIFGDPLGQSNQAIFAKVARWEEQHSNKKYYFYHSQSANVWKK